MRRKSIISPFHIGVELHSTHRSPKQGNRDGVEASCARSSLCTRTIIEKGGTWWLTPYRISRNDPGFLFSGIDVPYELMMSEGQQGKENKRRMCISRFVPSMYGVHTHTCSRACLLVLNDYIRKCRRTARAILRANIICVICTFLYQHPSKKASHFGNLHRQAHSTPIVDSDKQAKSRRDERGSPPPCC